MKNLYLRLVLMSTLVGAISCQVGSSVNALSDAGPKEDAALVEGDGGLEITETLLLNFSTESIEGTYAPKNVVAAWIEDADGNYVQTVGRWAAGEASRLVAWDAASGRDMDAVSGATRLDHELELDATWGITDAVADGDYTIRVEVAESNARTPEENTQASFPFIKDGTGRQESLIAEGVPQMSLDYSGRP